MFIAIYTEFLWLSADLQNKTFDYTEIIARTRARERSFDKGSGFLAEDGRQHFQRFSR